MKIFGLYVCGILYKLFKNFSSLPKKNPSGAHKLYLSHLFLILIKIELETPPPASKKKKNVRRNEQFLNIKKINLKIQKEKIGNTSKTNLK